MTFASFLAKTVLHLAAKTVQLLTQRQQQAIQTLLILLIHLATAVFKNAVGQIFKLGGETLLAVDQQALLLFRRHTGFLQTDGHLTQLGFLGAVHFTLGTQFLVQQFALVAPVIKLLKLFVPCSQLAVQIAQLQIVLPHLLFIAQERLLPGCRFLLRLLQRLFQ
ncbi:hypothetical protein D3C72_1692670 [compost metagenome]